MTDEGVITGTVDLYQGMQASELKTMFAKISKVVPTEVDSEFEAICQVEDQLQWRKGDLTNEIWKNVQGKNLKNKHGNPYTFLDVCFYVSAKYLRFSRSFNTVKAWALTARRYSHEVRRMYRSDEIPFSHFAYAAKKIFDVDSTTGQKRWQDVLDHSIDQMEKLGRNPSVLDLERHFEGKKKTPTTYQTGVYEFPSVEVNFAPVNVQDVDPSASVDLDVEIEFSELIHKLSGVVTRIVVRHPKYAGVIQQGFALLSNALQALQPQADETVQQIP